MFWINFVAMKPLPRRPLGNDIILNRGCNHDIIVKDVILLLLRYAVVNSAKQITF